MNRAQDDPSITQVNFGCGRCPTRGWHNYDSLIFVYLARLPFATQFLTLLSFIPRAFIDFMAMVRPFDIRFADASRRIPEPDESVHTIYSSHMLEHLAHDEAVAFLREAQRVLVRGGIIRIVVPNLDYFVREYLQDNDSQKFIKDLGMVSIKPKTLLKHMQYLIMGHRWHHAMYNEASLVQLIKAAGFINIAILKPGDTMIPYHSGLNLRENDRESIFLEAFKS
jgi:predicted SAM-dependent methyltransferase